MRKERIDILFGGLAGFISVAFLQLLTTGDKPLNVSLNVALIIFSFTLPLCIFYALSANEHLSVKKNVPQLYEIIAVIIIVASAIGITALFYYFGRVPAFIFGGTSLVVLIVFNQLDSNKRYYFPLRNNVKKGNKKRNSIL